MQPKQPDDYRAYQLTKSILAGLENAENSTFPFRHEDLLAANDTEEGRAALQKLVDLVQTSAAEVMTQTDILRNEGTRNVDSDHLQEKLKEGENTARFTSTEQLSALIKSLAQEAVKGPRIQEFSKPRKLELNNLRELNPYYRKGDNPNKAYIDLWEIAKAQKDGKPVAESLAAFQDGTFVSPSEQA